MLKSLPLTMAECLILTILIEGSVALIIGVRGKKNLATVTLVNVITNPLIVPLTFLVGYFYGLQARMVVEIAGEITVFIAEGLIYRKMPVHKKLNPFLFSLLLNGASYLSGYVINFITR
ncbi:MAG: hypothetical protein K6B52_00695 [Clostridiales bacterium]|nr:hypothetical protein [Clostridiales bacterium]